MSQLPTKTYVAPTFFSKMGGCLDWQESPLHGKTQCRRHAVHMMQLSQSGQVHAISLRGPSVPDWVPL